MFIPTSSNDRNDLYFLAHSEYFKCTWSCCTKDRQLTQCLSEISPFPVLYIIQELYSSARKDLKSNIMLHSQNNYITINQKGIGICMEWPTSMANGSGLCWVSHQALLWTWDNLKLTKITQTYSWFLSQDNLSIAVPLDPGLGVPPSCTCWYFLSSVSPGSVWFMLDN